MYKNFLRYLISAIFLILLILVQKQTLRLDSFTLVQQETMVGHTNMMKEEKLLKLLG